MNDDQDSLRPNLPEYSVSELSLNVKRTIEDAYGYVRVRGELGRVTRAGSGHVYLDLKDEKAVLSGVVWKGAAAKLRVKPEQGLEVIATGRLSTFPGQSRYQIIIDRLEPAGVGALMALLEERKKKLAAEGLFEDSRKKPLPYMPDVIGVVTSPSGAVIRDILHRLRDRFPRHVVVWPTLVQGEGAAPQVAAAIAGFNALAAGGPIARPDVLIVARGGGSIEDLWAFNEEVVARAAAASEIPLISAVGHETDTTLIDYVSDRRAPTPTAAAEMAVPVRTDLLRDLLDLERRLAGALTRGAETRRAHLQALARGLGRPEALYALPQQRFDGAANALDAAFHRLVQTREAALGRISARLGPTALRGGLERRGAALTAAGVGLENGLSRGLERRSDRLRALRLPTAQLERVRARGAVDVERLQRRLESAGRRKLEDAARRLDTAARQLRALSHESVLARGFALVRAPGGEVIASAKNAQGDAVVQFRDGARAARFENEGVPKTAAPSGAKQKGGQKPKKSAPEQSDLFGGGKAP